MKNQTKKPKLCLLITRADIGGAQKHVELLAKNICQEFEIEIIHGGGNYFNEKFNQQQIKITEITSINSLNFIFAIYHLTRHLTKDKPEIIHVHSSLASFYGRMSAKFLGIKCIYTVHGWFFSNPRRKSILWLGPKLERILKHYSRKTIFVSKFDLALAENLKCVDVSRAQYIHNSVEPPLQNLPKTNKPNRNAQFNLMFVGRLKWQKDPLLAIKSVQASASDINLTIYGDGPLKAELTEYIKANNLEGRIKIISDKSDLSDEYSAHDCLLITSKYEGMPLSALEAMSNSLPIIAIDTCGLKEMVENDYNGSIISNRSSRDLAKSIELFAEQPAARIKLGINSKIKYDNDFNLENFIKMTTDQYHSVIENK